MLKTFLKLAYKGPRILVRRLQAQGVRTTLVWLYARSVPVITGVPMLRYSQVTPQIYVGPQYRRAGKRKLERLGFRYCVNLRIEFDDAARGLALEGYCHLPTVDDAAPSLEHLEQGVAFIHKAVAEGGKVYIHCAGGMGRAPTLAAAYFISQGLKLEDAIELIRRVRRFINLTPAQVEQLKRFEAAQLEKH
jgi:protein tyrosine phosphatase (PTP) superfamily phosphohydrolase (DUF442 family)